MAKGRDICAGYRRGSDPEVTGGRCCCGLYWEGPEMPFHLEDRTIPADPERLLRRMTKSVDAAVEAGRLKKQLQASGSARPYGRGHPRLIDGRKRQGK